MTRTRTRATGALGLLAALALVTVGLSGPGAAAPAAPGPAVTAAQEPAPDARAAQTLTWTAGNSTTAYTEAPTEAVAGPTTIVFENSTATGNTSGMQHTLTFDTAGGEYNDDVDLDLLAFPTDENDGRWEVDVTLTEGTYRFLCTIPGHGQMQGELVVTGGGGEPGEDTTAPSVSATLDGEQDADGAFIGQATASVEATDADSGIETVEYQVDDTGWLPYTEPVVVDEVGDHTFGYRATDAAGNTSEEGVEQLTVVAADGPDTTPPTVEAMLHGDTNADGHYLGAAEVMLTAEDSQSEIASVEYAVDGGEWQTYAEEFEVAGEGEHTVTYRATDAAGNVSEVGEVSFTVAQAPDDDTEAPTVAVDLTGELDATWAYRGTATATLSATDEGSGVASVEYRLDDGAWETYEEPVEVDDPGAHVMRHRATDLGGNVSEVGLVRFTIAESDDGTRCRRPDTSPVVVIGDIGTTVRNRSVGGGCTVDDLIRDEVRWADHAAFLTHVRTVTTQLVGDGYLSGAERNQIVRAAQRSAVGHES